MNAPMESNREALAFTEAELKELEWARTLPITFDEDSPETTPERALRFRRVNPRGGKTYQRKSVMEGGLPFDMRQPNATTAAAMRETEDILAGRVQARRFASAKELFEDLDTDRYSAPPD